MRIELEPTLYQSFEEISDPSNVSPRVVALRAKMNAAGLDAFLIPLADAHRGESLPDCEQRLAYITGFTGSAGIAIVSSNKAALIVDGRYTIQAPAQTDTNIFEILKYPDDKLNDWITNNLPAGAKLGFDPWLHTPDEVKSLNKIPDTRCALVPVENLVDAIWNDRPAPPKGEVELLGPNRAGISRKDKLDNLQQTLSKEGADNLVLSLPDSINWLFNIRGRDVPNTPVVLSFAIVPQTGKPSLFLDIDKLSQAQMDHLGGFLNIVPTDQFPEALKTLSNKDATIWVDPASCPYAVLDILTKGSTSLIKKTDPNMLPKAIKNAAELAGMHEAHRLDGIALAKFLCWFDKNCGTGQLSEINIVRALEAFRRQEKTLVDISFDTISGSGPNGAIVHYRVTNSSNRKLKPGELMLVDSGGQYLSGTTDITRTMFTGSVNQQQKNHNTRVLKGMISITVLQFLPKTTGAHLDILARQFLWQIGLNYNHGTGHGVGAFLSVHEGPASISPLNNIKLENGMILSNEPGYYLEGEYGIRIENLIHIVDSEITEGWMAFETLTLAPIDTRLIDVSMLTNVERNWLNTYHTRVLAVIGPSLEGEELAWLEKATAAV